MTFISPDVHTGIAGAESRVVCANRILPHSCSAIVAALHSHEDARSGIIFDMEAEPGRFLRVFFTLLALVVIALPVLGVLASGRSVKWGTVPEWIAALSLLVIAAATWRLVRGRERSERARDASRSDA